MNGSGTNTGADQMVAYGMVYPEIYYRVQPFVMAVCDQMKAYGGVMPSAEVIESIADNIYTDVITMYPDLAEYAGDAVASASAARMWPMGDDPNYAQPTIAPFYRRRFRRRGVFRDFVEILLLNEIFRRL